MLVFITFHNFASPKRAKRRRIGVETRESELLSHREAIVSISLIKFSVSDVEQMFGVFLSHFKWSEEL